MVSLNVEHQLIWSSLKTRRFDASPPLQDSYPTSGRSRLINVLSRKLLRTKGGKEAAPKPYMLPTLAMTL